MAFRLISGEWETEILSARRGNPAGLRVICPFIKQHTLKRILEAGRRSPLQVVTRFELGCFYNGVSDLDALREILDAGGAVRGVKGLHAKLFLFAEASTIATSANVTDAAMRRNHEFGFVSDDSQVVSECRAYFERLWKGAGKDLIRQKLDSWDDMLEEARRRNGSTQRPHLPDFGADVDAPTPFTSAATAGNYENGAFLKFFGQGSNRSPRHVMIADLVADSGCNWACTYPSSRRPRQVRDGDLIYMARISEPNDLLIYGSAIARQHREDDVASAADLAARPWKERWGNYVRVHSPRFVNAPLSAGIPMLEMMTSLQSDSFAPTQRNAQGIGGNRDPFLSYLRKPGMELTEISREWIGERLEPLFRRYGEVDLSDSRFRPPS